MTASWRRPGRPLTRNELKDSPDNGILKGTDRRTRAVDSDVISGLDTCVAIALDLPAILRG